MSYLTRWDPPQLLPSESPVISAAVSVFDKAHPLALHILTYQDIAARQPPIATFVIMYIGNSVFALYSLASRDKLW
jgi:hypothetical protein